MTQIEQLAVAHPWAVLITLALALCVVAAVIAEKGD